MSADTNSLLERLPLLHGRVIDYGHKASPSKARHEHSVIREWRRVLCCRAGCWCQQGHSHPLVIQLRPTPIPNHVAVLMRVFHSRSIDYERKTHLKRWWHEESSIRPTSVRMELNAPFSQEWAFCIDDTSLLSPLAARWFGIIPPSTVVTDFLSGNTMTFFLDYRVPPCRP